MFLCCKIMKYLFIKFKYNLITTNIYNQDKTQLFKEFFISFQIILYSSFRCTRFVPKERREIYFFNNATSYFEENPQNG